MLTCPATFFAVDTDLEWFSEQRREHFSVNMTLARTTIQRIFDINARRNELGGKCTPQMVHDLYKKNLHISERSEPVTLTFIERSFVIWDRALSLPSVRAVVLAQEELRTESRFCHSSKIYIMVTKARTEEHIEWVFTLANDYYRANLLSKDAFSTTAIDGRDKSMHGKGLIDLWIMKRMMLLYFLDELLPSKSSIPCSIKSSIREACSSCVNFRKKVGYKHDSAGADQSWRAGWPKYADRFLELVEDAHMLTKSRRASC